jgi:hypothetical protein
MLDIQFLMVINEQDDDNIKYFNTGYNMVFIYFYPFFILIMIE